jgi:hypothetical protein
MGSVRRGQRSTCGGALLVVMAALTAGGAQRDSDVAERVRAITRESRWTLLATHPLAFAAHHPQGMVKIGETFFVSSVEITVRTRRYPQPVGGVDRDAGEGVGHLFKFGADGSLLAHLRLGEGAIYHPGGIDYDGTHIWVPVAEYRPDSRSIVYRVDPRRMEAVEVFRFPDHIGALVHDTAAGTLHGVSWGSRRLYRWGLGHDGRVTGALTRQGALQAANGSHYVDYQDCQYVGGRRMLCTGLAELRQGPDGPPLRLGGMELVDLADARPVHQVPVPLWTAGGLPMTRNPSWVEPGGAGLRAYFMPDDDRATIYVYGVGAGSVP